MSDFDEAVHVLRAARNIVFFTGAGISAESDIPTFRDKLTGIWRQYRPEDLETANAFRKDSTLVWSWYLQRRYQASQARPNAAHNAVSELAATARNVAVVTQNIDDLHERAGSLNVMHLHGSLERPKCFACHRTISLAIEQFSFTCARDLVEPPRCGRCKGRLRPGVLWFGEALPKKTWNAAIKKVRGCEVLISIGTSGFVTPAAEIPEIALRAGAIVIHINLEDVALGDPRELMLLGTAASVLPKLISEACLTL